jgi:TetR/AcrR family transcriptional regulator, transcriptional repressor for nem operon
MATLTKGERTRRRIVERCAPIFNQRGYAGASMRDLVAASGLEKGGIYNHFGSKEALARAAFDHSVSLLAERFTAARASSDDAIEQLEAVVRAFGRWAREPALPGGCPIMNTAIETVDTNPELRAHARDAMSRWHRLVGAIVKHGVATGSLEPSTDPYELATLVTSSLEGALMLTRLYDDAAHMDRVVAHLVAHVKGLRR